MNKVRLTNKDKTNGNEETKYISSNWLIVFAITLGKPCDVWIQLILAEGLKYFGC